MKKSNIFILIISFLILLNCLYVSSKLLIGDTTTTNGYLIEPVIINHLKTNQDYTFNVHVINKSNGVPIVSATSCYFHLYNSTGGHLLELEDSSVSHKFDYDFTVKGANFTKGFYQVKIQCNSTTNEGGVNEMEFEVNNLGKETGIAESILYVALTIAVLLLFGVALYVNIIIPWGDLRNEIGELIFIGKMKYFKVGMILVTYGLFVWLLNLLVGISDNFLSLTMYYGFFSFIFTIFMVLSPYVFIVVFILSIALLIRDKMLKNIIMKFGKVAK